MKNYSFTVVDGTVYYRENSRMHPTQLSETAAQRVRGLIGLRNCVRSLITLETEDRPEPEIEAKQAELNQLYDDFQQEFGVISSQQNRRAFSDDDSYYLLCSLEILDEEGKLERKADIFTKRTIRPKAAVTHVETAQEALTICLNDLAVIDMDYLAQLTGKDAETLEQELSGQIYRLPNGNLDAPTFVLAEEYLSGNVREKAAGSQSRSGAASHLPAQCNSAGAGAAGGLKPSRDFRPAGQHMGTGIRHTAICVGVVAAAVVHEIADQGTLFPLHRRMAD